MVGKARSCTACRQAKMACDARKKAPEPCSRCNNKNFTCRFDKSFKRVSTRQITRDIADGVAIVRKPLNEPADDHARSSHTESEDHRELPVSNGDGQSSGFRLDNFVVPSNVVVQLVRHFECYYLTHAPFFMPIKSLDHLVATSPLLFWTILLIACQSYDAHHALYSQLLSPYQELLKPLSTRAIHSIDEIHALLLLCIWPLPTKRPLLDPTWTYINIAIGACTKMNFHKPLPQGHIAQGFASWPDTSAAITVNSQKLTWLACFIISTQAAVLQGVLPPLSSYSQLKYIRKALDRAEHLDIRPDYQASIVIYEVICNYSVSLEDVETPAMHFSLTQTFDGRLDAIKHSYTACWTPELDIQLIYAKLNLYAMSALLPLRETNRIDMQDDVNRQIILPRGLESSSLLIARMKELSISPVNKGFLKAGKLSTCPRVYFACLFFTATYLFRSLVDHHPMSRDQASQAVEGLVEARKLFGLVPRLKDAAMAAEVLEKVVDRLRSADAASSLLSSSQLLITNRHGASLLYDILFRMQFRAQRNFYHVLVDRIENTRDDRPPGDTLVIEMQPHLMDSHSIPFDPLLIQDPVENLWLSLDISIDGMVLDLDQQMFF